MKWLWIAVIPVVAVTVLLSSSSVPAADESNGDPKGTSATYTVTFDTWVNSDQESKSKDEFTVTVYDLPKAVKSKKKTVIEYRMALVVEGDLDSTRNLPLGTMTRGDGFVGTDIEHPQGRVVSRAFQPFYDNPINLEHVKSLDSGDEFHEIPALALRRVPVQYRTKAGKNAKAPIRYAIKLKESPFSMRKGVMETTLNKYTLQFLLEPTTHRILESTMVVDYSRNFGSGLYEKKETITIKETSFRELKTSEVSDALKELELLEPLTEVTLGGGVDFLRRNEKERNALKRNLSAYKKKHAKDGLLAKAFPGIEAAFNLNLKKSGMSSNPEDIATAMVKETAPGFTLKNLSGDNVSLSDFKGQAVLINFWAVL